MDWLQIIILVVVAVVIFKFIVKPVFKVVGLVVLALVAWWLLGHF